MCSDLVEESYCVDFGDLFKKMEIKKMTVIDRFPLPDNMTHIFKEITEKM